MALRLINNHLKQSGEAIPVSYIPGGADEVAGLCCNKFYSQEYRLG